MATATAAAACAENEYFIPVNQRLKLVVMVIQTAAVVQAISAHTLTHNMPKSHNCNQPIHQKPGKGDA